MLCVHYGASVGVSVVDAVCAFRNCELCGVVVEVVIVVMYCFFHYFFCIIHGTLNFTKRLF